MSLRFPVRNVSKLKEFYNGKTYRPQIKCIMFTISAPTYILSIDIKKQFYFSQNFIITTTTPPLWINFLNIIFYKQNFFWT